MKKMHQSMILLVILSMRLLGTCKEEINQHDHPIVTEVLDTSLKKPMMQLFVYQDCFYCTKVCKFLLEHKDIFSDNIEFINADTLKNRKALKMISGKTQAPYLVDPEMGVSMPESDDIIAYLSKKFNISAPMYKSITIGEKNNLDHLTLYNPTTFLHDVYASDKPVIILASATWCGPCKNIKPFFFDVASKMGDVCEFILLDIDKNPEIATQLKINYIPSLLCYKNGKCFYLEYERTLQGLFELVHNLLKI